MASEACSPQSDCAHVSNITVEIRPGSCAAETQDGTSEFAGSGSRGAERLVHLIPVVLMLSMAVLWTFQKDDAVSTSIVHSSSHLSVSPTLYPSSFKADRRLLDGAVEPSDGDDSALESPAHRRSTLAAEGAKDDTTAHGATSLDAPHEGNLETSFRGLQALLRPLGMA